MTTRTIPSKEVAKLVRKELKATFGKAAKFSVRSDYNSVRVDWTDGPTVKEVEKVIGHFEGGSFDGMTDSYNYRTSQLDGEEVQFGNKYLFTQRSESLELYQTVQEIITAQYPQIVEEGRFSVEYGSYVQWYATENRTSGVDWDRIFRRAVWAFDASTGQHIYTDLLHMYGDPDNWQYHENAEPVEVEPEPVVEYEPYTPPTIEPICIAHPKEKIIVEGVKFPRLNKQCTLQEYKEELSDSSIERCDIVKIVTLSPEDWDVFSHHLLDSFDWLADEGGVYADVDVPENPGEWTDADRQLFRENAFTLTVAVVAEGKRTLFVNPEGHNYARHVGLN